MREARGPNIRVFIRGNNDLIHRVIYKPREGVWTIVYDADQGVNDLSPEVRDRAREAAQSTIFEAMRSQAA